MPSSSSSLSSIVQTPINREKKRNRSYKVRQEVMEQLFQVNKPNISLAVPVNGPYPCTVHSSTVSVDINFLVRLHLRKKWPAVNIS
ncbi:hypothetical protein L873DRAFT_1817165 [Choiromyces venosus 120613-1]|uniref:Uncharacterized protein n=1 Tax=Choiromyces venosus 120613-1 TaxID=1336337 RepID=A0A3N4J371_9PEZI|nr:hypothetical protein L873DRAFT_1817165 [Choiromyces venosus 120613-1]